MLYLILYVKSYSLHWKKLITTHLSEQLLFVELEVVSVLGMTCLLMFLQNFLIIPEKLTGFGRDM
jgi:hypothetical protein